MKCAVVTTPAVIQRAAGLYCCGETDTGTCETLTSH